mmetsp:Transcript_23154/g.82702  ORF Transcript_23154/g.82702 Transcript_23154/m.82702 type:complete len:92 (+) Transcript_23154:169-444(+)
MWLRPMVLIWIVNGLRPPPGLTRFAFRVAYDGGAFEGWQIQHHPRRTIRDAQCDHGRNIRIEHPKADGETGAAPQRLQRALLLRLASAARL